MPNVREKEGISYNNFIISNDSYQWILQEKYLGLDKNKNTKEHIKETYHGTLAQIARVILDREAKSCKTLKEVIELYTSTSEKLEKYLIKANA